MHVININAVLQWKVALDRQSHELVAVCDPLGLVMHGRDLADLQASINESLNLLFRELLKQGELPAFLNERGWTSADLAQEEDGEPSFHVPWELIAKGNKHGQAGALH